jgi:hypothetical protein
MPLVAAAMGADMLSRAVSKGLIDAPPYFALSRIYNAVATGIVKTLQAAATVVTVQWTGFVPVGASIGTANSISGPDPDGYGTDTQTEAGHTGPFAPPFYYGLGGVIDYIKPNISFVDLLCPVAAGGAGVLVSIVVPISECHDNIVAAMPDDFLCKNPNPPGCPDGSVRAPPPRFVPFNYVYYEMDQMIKAASHQLAVYLLHPTQTTWTMTGVPTIAPISTTDIFTRIL